MPAPNNASHPKASFAVHIFDLLKRWLLTGVVVLFFTGIIWQFVNFAKAGASNFWSSFFELIGISSYTDKMSLAAAALATLVVAMGIGALLYWQTSRRFLASIPYLGKVFGLTASVIESVDDLQGMPIVLVETYNGLRQLALVSGFEPIRKWRLLREDENLDHLKTWELFGVHLRLGRPSHSYAFRLRVYYPDFPFIINGRGGWAEARSIEWVLNPFDEIFARLASAGFATSLKPEEPITLANDDWETLGLDMVALTEEELIKIVNESKKLNPSA